MACINNNVEELHSDVWNKVAAVLDLTAHQFHNIGVILRNQKKQTLFEEAINMWLMNLCEGTALCFR